MKTLVLIDISILDVVKHFILLNVIVVVLTKS